MALRATPMGESDRETELMVTPPDPLADPV